MRRFLLLASVLLLAGCTDADWAHFVPERGADEAPAFPTPSAAANFIAYSNGQGSAPTPEQKCTRTAKERTSDIAAQGYDEDLQKQAYDRIYADCMSWSARTGR